MEFNLRALVLTVGWLCFLSRPIHGARKYFQVEYPPSTAANQLQISVTYIMYFPTTSPDAAASTRPQMVITFIALVRAGVKQNERDFFWAEKLLTTVRIQAGEPAILIRKVSPRWSTEKHT